MNTGIFSTSDRRSSICAASEVLRLFPASAGTAFATTREVALKGRAVAQQCLERRGRQGSAEEIALPFGTLQGLQKGELRLRFYAFGDDLQLEAAAQGDDGGDDDGFVRVAIDILNKRLVNLERIDRKSPQIAQARIPGTEVING